MRYLIPVLILACVTGTPGTAAAQGDDPVRVILDTDFAMPPQDDALALVLALQSPEIEILGITTVAGNRNIAQANTDVLRMLEIAQRADIPVYQGASRPLVHQRSDYAVQKYGSWYSDEPPLEPPGGFAKKKLENAAAVDYIVQTVLANPGNITIVAIGPLTNIATAIRTEPSFSVHVKRLVVMGGAIALLPDGAGNMTPNAEFNFWVDPEAARITLRSGIPIELSPLNVSRKSELTKDWFDRMVQTDTPITRLLRTTMGPQLATTPGRKWLMYDQIAVASIIDPTLVTRESLFVDVDTDPGINYGVSVGGRDIWPGAEDAREMDVQYDLDWPRFIEMFADRVQRPLNTN